MTSSSLSKQQAIRFSFRFFFPTMRILSCTLFFSLCRVGKSFHVPQQVGSVPFRTKSVVQIRAVNGGGTEESGGIMLADDAKSQLFSAFSALDLSDQYDAVLTGLCAKILDDTEMTQEKAQEALQDPIQLMQEMNMKRTPASPRSLMALIDSAAKTQDAKLMASVLSLSVKNAQGIQQFGAQQADILALPTNPSSKVRCPDGSFKTRDERLDGLPDVPTDEREKETTYALGFAGLLAVCGTANLIHLDDITPLTNTLLFSVVTVGALDNFYDLLSTGINFVASQVQKDNKDQKEINLPAKDSLPLGLGTGQLSGSTVRGISRLITIDAERESKCEAAALYAAYVLGLPCFAFRPNAYEGAVLVVDSTRNDNNLDSLLSSSGILRMLVWLLAPCAAELMSQPQLIMSDPREASGFLNRLEEFAEKSPEFKSELWWLGDEKERAALLKWAFAEADLLLRANRATVAEISKRLSGGAATIGDCIAVGENWQ